MPKCSLQRMTNNVRCTFSGAIPHMWLQLVLGKTNIIGHTKYIIYFGYVLFFFLFLGKGATCHAMASWNFEKHNAA